MKNNPGYNDYVYSFSDNKIKVIPGCNTIHDLIELNRSLRDELHSKCQVSSPGLNGFTRSEKS